MKNKDINLSLNPKAIVSALQNYSLKLRRYSLIAFIVLVAVVYGSVVLRINTLRNVEPTTDEVASQVKAAHTPHIDEKVVQQLQSLQDNSVSVKALFDQARSNPFQ